MEDAETRFTHLLQPIRDMTKNWEVDVAAQLGEYLEELDHICISFDGGKTTMNFAEAALLIQGSACIYSKKVEYLYSLVYQALDFISNKKRDQQPASVGADGVDKDAHFVDNSEEEFLVLDDFGDPKKTNVNMKKDQNSNPVNIVPLTPMALVPPEEVEKKTNPLCSRKGETLASRKDFRMNTCTTHTCGAFVLELAIMSPMQFKENTQRTEDGNNCPGLMNAEQEERNDNMEEGCGDPVAVLNFSDADAPLNNGDDVFVPLNDHHEVEDENMEPAEHIERQQIQTEERGYVLRPREVKEIPIIKDNQLDAWQSLDPFKPSEDKPFKKGKHYTLPRGVVDVSSNKRKRKLPCKLQDFLKWFSSTCHSITEGMVEEEGFKRLQCFLGTWVELRSFQVLSLKALRNIVSDWDGAEAVKHRKKGPTFPDMDVLYWKHVKERLTLQKQLQKRMGPLVTKVADLLAEEEPTNHIEEPRDDYLDEEDCADLSDHEDLGQTFPAILTDMPACENIEPIDFDGQISYEELVRKNVELYIANSQKYAQETVLSLRVREWEDKMGPQLQEQEERGAFDIHDYGDRLVSQYNQVGEWHTFASLMAHREPYEVCRYMLASLQLANDYTVEVSQKPGLYEGVDTMALRLLSQQKAHERFKTYTAPSLS